MVSKDYHITHRGRVVGLNDNEYLVEVIPGGGHDCGACAISQFCNGSHGRKMIVGAVTGEAIASPSIGDRVEIAVGTGMRAYAAILLLVVPLVMMLFVAVALSCSGLSDLVTGISAITVVALSYFFIHLVLRRQAAKWVIVKIVN